MSDLPNVTGQQAISALSKLGYSVIRVRGSHHIMKREGFRFRLSVPKHGNKNLKPGTLRRLIRTAEISVEEFCELLD